MREIVEPVIAGMAKEGHPFRGFLFVGLMLTAAGPKVIEFNVRLGDPETQAMLTLIDEPLLPILVAGATGELRQSSIRIGRDSVVGVVMASRGYPESAESGRIISGVEAAEMIPGVAVYHAGTARRDGHLVTAGGRVLTVVGRGADFAEAIARAYAGVLQISFDGMQYRHDIGRKALAQAFLVPLCRSVVKYSVITFGCRVNQADSLNVEEGFRAHGAIAAEAEEADIVVVNTCSVTASADQAARQTIRRIARINPAAKIVVTGCYATRRPDEVADLPGVMRVVPNDDKPALISIVRRVRLLA